MWKSSLQTSSSWRRIWKADAYLRHLFGATFARSTDDRCAAVLTYWSAEFHASRTQWQGDRPVPLIRGICGHRRPASWEKCALPWCSLRTLATSSDTRTDSEESARIFKRWATGLRARWSKRLTQARHTAGSDSSYSDGGQTWPTPDAGLFNQSEHPDGWHARNMHHTGRVGQGPLGIVAQEVSQRLWMTANVPNGGRLMNARDVAAKGMTDRGKRQVDLSSQARHWMTATSRDWKDGACQDVNVPTNGLLGRQAVRATPDLIGRPDPATLTDGATSSDLAHGWRLLRLNPWFTDWLMFRNNGIGWTCRGATAHALTASGKRGTRSYLPKLKLP
jgi:hypothetical protein